jgi:hypothetical protein
MAFASFRRSSGSAGHFIIGTDVPRALMIANRLPISRAATNSFDIGNEQLLTLKRSDLRAA